MNCPNCNKEVSPEWNVCPHCGYKPKKCSNPSCNAGWLPKEAKFCPVCGRETTAESSTHHSSHTSSRSSSSSNDGCGFTLISFFLAVGLGGIGVAMIEDEILDIGISCIIGAVVLGIVWIYRVFKS